MNKKIKAEVIATLIAADRPDLANLVANEDETTAKGMPPAVQEAFDQFKSAQEFRYPSGTVSNLWKEFAKVAKQHGIDPRKVK